MRTKRIFAIATSVTMLAIVVAVVLLRSIDFNQYRDQFSTQVEDLTGRSLNIAGDVELSLSLSPILSVNDVAFGNASSGSGPHMIRVKRLEVQVPLIPLLLGEAKARRITLQGVELLLETDPEGQGNWIFQEARETETGREGDEALFPAVKEVSLKDLRLTWRDGVSGKTTTMELATLSASAKDFSQPLTLSASGMVNGQTFKVEGIVGALADLRGGEPFPLDLKLELAGADITVQGTVAEPLAGKGLVLRIQGKGRELADFSMLAGVELPVLGPWNLDFALVDFPGGLMVDKLAIKFAGSDLSGQISLKLDDKRPVLDAGLRSELLNLSPFAGDPVNAKGMGSGEPKDKIFSREPLPLDGLRAFDAQLAYQTDRLVLPNITVQDLRTEVVLQDGKLNVAPLKANLAQGLLLGQVELNAANGLPELAMNLSVKGLDSGELLQSIVGEKWLAAKGDMAIKLRGQGASVAELMAGLNGRTRLLIGRGQADIKAVDNLIGGLSKVVGTLVSEKKQSAALNCVASQFEIRNGIATSKVLLADTEFSTVVGEGTIDLGKERLDLLLKPKPKSVTLSVAVPVEIGGTLANPSFTPEKLATATKAVGVLAVVGAVTFPPTALLGLVEMGSGKENPCLGLSSGKGAPKSAKTQGAQEAEKDSSVVDKAADEVKKTFESVSGALKGLFGK